MVEEEFYTEQDEVLKQLVYRREHAEENAQKLDTFILKKYGILGFANRLMSFLKKSETKSGKGTLYLARAIPSFSLEDLYVDMLCHKLSLGVGSISLSSDGLSGSSEDKLSRVRLTSFTNPDHVVELMGTTDNLLYSIPIFALQTKYEIGLLDWHNKKRRSIFEDSTTNDLSEFLAELVSVATLKPDHVYIYNEGKMKKGMYTDDLLRDNKIFRPCASWWYPIFLSVFVLDNVLYDDYSKQMKNKDVEFSRIVFDSFKEIEEVTGIRPLILRENLSDKIAFSYIPESIHSENEFSLKYKKFKAEFSKPFNEINFFESLKSCFTE